MMAGSAVDHGRGRDSPAPLEHENHRAADDRRQAELPCQYQSWRCWGPGMREEEDLGTWVHVQAGPHCTTKSAYPHLHLCGHRHTHLYQSLPASCLPITKSPKPGACSNVQVQKAQWYCYLIAVRYTAASPFIYMKHSLRLEYKQLPMVCPARSPNSQRPSSVFSWSCRIRPSVTRRLLVSTRPRLVVIRTPLKAGIITRRHHRLTDDPRVATVVAISEAKVSSPIRTRYPSCSSLHLERARAARASRQHRVHQQCCRSVL